MVNTAARLAQRGAWLDMSSDKTGAAEHGQATLEVLCLGDTETLRRPCADCGHYTGRYCDYCLAANRIPSETWAPGQATPFCSSCDDNYDGCHYCRGIHMARPFAWG